MTGDSGRKGPHDGSATGLVVSAPDGVGEVVEGDDLTALALSVCDLRDGDILTITSKVVSKAEGRLRSGDREVGLAAETARVVARRGPTTIVRNHLGLTMAAAGIDASNVVAGHHLLLPEDPDRTAASVRSTIAERVGANVGVLITDTAGRAWRNGQSDIAIGAAGLLVLQDFAGQQDSYGNELAVTAPAVGDELAGAAELAGGKLAGRPFAVVRGRADLVLPVGEHGAGARSLVREDGADMFGYGAREAVVHALSATGGAVFGTPSAPDDLGRAVAAVLHDPEAVSVLGDGIRARLSDPHEPALARLSVLAFAFGWTLSATVIEDTGMVDVTFLPISP